MATLDDFQRRLEEKRNELLGWVSKLESDRLRPADPPSADSAERAQELENDEVAQSLDETGRRELAEIESALQRIDAGTYGRCLGCGGEIGPERLDALPQTPLCIQCASRNR